MISISRWCAGLLVAATAACGGCMGASQGIAAADAGAGTDGGGDAAAGDAPSSRLEQLQRAHVELRFGMFIHFGILTYTGMWAQPNLDITQFNPTQLDPNQWAEAAVSAHMTYGVLTTRHHDGFALWDSQAGTFDVGSIPWMNGQGDVVRAYVDAFRAHGLLPGLYYSIWDATEGIGNPNAAGTVTVTPPEMDYIETQLTELLTNYGPIPLLIFDGWSWKMGHRLVDYAEIRRLVKSLQPDCLMLDNTHLDSPYENDLVGVEEAEGNSFIPADNTFPATQMQKINGTGGNDWFWAPDIGGIMTATGIVNGHLDVLEPRWTNFLLNCPPNRDGLLDPAIVSRLAEVGAAWSPDTTRPPLPPQGPQIERPYDPVAATATSGRASSAIDGLNDFYYYSVWETTDPLPQSITIDLGQVHPDVSIVNYVPRNVYAMGPSADGAITAYEIATSVDGAAFTTVASGTWAADAKMKTAAFPPAVARFVRLTANAANGDTAAATEIAVGAAP